MDSTSLPMRAMDMHYKNSAARRFLRACPLAVFATLRVLKWPGARRRNAEVFESSPRGSLLRTVTCAWWSSAGPDRLIRHQRAASRAGRSAPLR